MNSKIVTSTIASRDMYWDLVKALLIFLVIFGHSIQYIVYHNANHISFWNDPLFKGIYIFHMPLFMLISGYFAAISYSRRRLSVIPRYLKRLALPCIGYGVYQLLKMMWFGGAISPTRIYFSFIELWFLVVVFECVVCYIVYEYLSKNFICKIILIIIPIVISIIVSRFFPFSLFWPHSYYFTFLWPFFMTGCCIYKCNLMQYITDWKYGMLAMFLYLICFFVFKESWYVYRTPMNFSLERIGINAFRYFSGLMGSFSVLFILKFFSNDIRLSIIQKIGQATLAIYILQSLVICQLAPYITECGYIKAFFISLLILIALFYFYRITRCIPVFNLLAYGENNK